MGRPATGRSPVITIKLLKEERERLEASLPPGGNLSRMGRKRLEVTPDPSQWDEEAVREPLEILAREEFQMTSVQNRAIWLRKELFPDYEPVEYDEVAPTGARLTGKRGRKSANYRFVEGRTVDILRDRKVKVRVSPETHERIQLIAEALGLPVGTYCRRLLMEEPAFGFDASMGVNGVVKHAEAVLAVKSNGLNAEMERAAERLVTAEAEKIARAAFREMREEQRGESVSR